MKYIELTEEQILLQQSATRYLADKYDFATRERILKSEKGYDEIVWRDFAKMGWLALPFPEQYGGIGGNLFDVMLLMQAFGRSLVVEPYLSSILLGGQAVLAAGTEEQKMDILPKLALGDLQLSLAFAEPDSSYDLARISTVAVPDGGGFRLTGHKAVVLGAQSCDYFIVSATIPNANGNKGGALFLVERTSSGVRLRGYQTIDGRRGAEVLLENVFVTETAMLGKPGDAVAVTEQAVRAATIAELGVAIGLLDGSIALSISHLNAREQFGKKLASFQVLRHRIADMYVLRQECAQLTFLAARALAQSSSDAQEMISGAKVHVGSEGQWIVENAVQLHGAIGITDEYIVGHYLKRMIAINRLFGDKDHHLDVITRVGKIFA
jgi:alkylation response protein AidB-like acyl-CoA dehydrogenase